MVMPSISAMALALLSSLGQLGHKEKRNKVFMKEKNKEKNEKIHAWYIRAGPEIPTREISLMTRS